MTAGQLWKVVGGGSSGGIVVRTGKDTTSEATTERLATGAIIKETQLDEERLQFTKVTGSGPRTGWVSLKLKGKDLVVKTDEEPERQLWEVVGGGTSGGILVRMGKDTGSEAASERLATGALVQQLALEEERLQFELVSGSGPRTGWVSLKLKGKDLLTRKDEAAADSAPLPRAATKILDASKPGHVPEVLVKTLRGYDMKDVQANITANLPGDHFNEPFPHTPEQLREMGAEWLTKAFHAAGTLPLENRVKELKSMKDFVGGGAAVKALLEVEYEQPSAELHTWLFVKMPLDPSHKNRTTNFGLAMEGSEIMFNRFFINSLPFRTAKFYFGDICMKSSNWILISEKIEFADDSQKGKKLGPNEVEPVVPKGLDFLLSDPLEKYVALYRRAAMVSAWAHTGKLGPQVDELFKSPINPKMFFVTMKVMEKQFNDFWPKTEEFVLNYAKSLFPADVANAEYMAQLKREIAEVGPALNTVNKYVVSEDLWIFMHPNLHLDNAFYYRDENDDQDTGLLDWAGMSIAFALVGFVSGGGALSLASAEMRIPHTDSLVRCFFETLREFGGPVFDVQDMCLRVALMDMAYIIGSMKLMDTGRPGDVYEYLPKERYLTVTGMGDPVFTAGGVEPLMLRSVVAMLVEGIKTWKGKDYIKIFSKWRVKNPK